MAHPVLGTVLMAASTTMLDGTTANSTTSAGSTESATNLLSDRINLIAATTALGFTYGIMATLYMTTTYYLLKRLLRRNGRGRSHPHYFVGCREASRNTIFYLVYTSVLFVLATLYTAGNSQNAIVAYVDNRLYPGGPYEYYITFMAGQSVMIMTDVTSFIILWLTDALILFRFILFYYKLRYARWLIPLPCAMYVGVIVLSTLVLRGEAGLGKIFYLSENLMLAYYTLSFSLNVLSTLLIAARLYFHKSQLDRVFGSKVESPYMRIATVLIESAALYGTWSLVFLLLSIIESPGQTVVLATMSQIQVIAPLLIILWIARGKAWGSTTRSGTDTDTDADAHHHSATTILGDPSDAHAHAHAHPSGSAGSGIPRFSLGSPRPHRHRPPGPRIIVDDDDDCESFDCGDARPSRVCRGVEKGGESRSTVMDMDMDVDVDVDVVDLNLIELGLYGSGVPSTIDEYKM